MSNAIVAEATVISKPPTSGDGAAATADPMVVIAPAQLGEPNRVRGA